MLAVFSAAVPLGATSLATADASRSSSANKPAAQVLFDEGVLLVERGEVAAGCAKLEASEALDAAVGTLLHLADCYERSWRLASAWARFMEARSLAEAQGMLERVRIATLRANYLEPKLARVTVHVAGPIAPALQVRLGNTVVPRESWGSPLPFDAGVLKVVATAPGYHDFERTVEVPSQDAARVAIHLPPLRKRPARAATSSPARGLAVGGGPQRAIAITVAVIGGLGLGASGALSLLAKRRYDDSLEHCPRSPNLCSAKGLELRDEASDMANGATVAVGAGAALLGAGLVIHFTAPRPLTNHRAKVWLAADLSGRSTGLRAGASY